MDEGGSGWTKRGKLKTKAGWPTTTNTGGRAHLQLTKKERVLITDMQLEQVTFRSQTGTNLFPPKHNMNETRPPCAGDIGQLISFYLYVICTYELFV